MIRIGTKSIANFKLDSRQVDKIMLGTRLVWSKEPPPPPPPVDDIFEDGSTIRCWWFDGDLVDNIAGAVAEMRDINGNVGSGWSFNPNGLHGQCLDMRTNNATAFTTLVDFSVPSWPSSHEFTVSFWVNTPNKAGLFYQDSAAPPSPFALYLSGISIDAQDVYSMIYVSTTVSPCRYILSPSSPYHSIWTHLAATFWYDNEINRHFMEGFINGQSYGSCQHQDANTVPFDTLALGGAESGTCLIDGLRFINRRITEEEALILATEFNPYGRKS